MDARIALFVTFVQVLIVLFDFCLIKQMVTMLTKNAETELEWIEFSKRFNELLDARDFAPKGHGRQVQLAEMFGLTQKGVRKWVEGEGMPKTTQMMRIARDFQCNFEWLSLGSGPRDATQGSHGPHAELVRRIEAAPPETVRLIEIALMPDTDLEKTPLSPSLKGLVGAVKSLVREEMNRGDPRA